MLREWMRIVEGLQVESIATPQRVKLADLYDEGELEDESEAMYQYVDPEDLDRTFIVREMTPDEAKTYTTPHNDMTVIDAFKQFASKEQKSLVKGKRAQYDASRIIVVINKTVLDGNHHIVAGILNRQPIRYIDLADYEGGGA